MKSTQSVLMVVFMLVSLNAFSQQNVGVNKTNPTQALDVNGNVNVDGNLMVNGQAGQAGQVLSTNSSGATQWVDFSEFKNVFQNYTGIVSVVGLPITVTRIGVELQGGGGAGSNNGGGSAGNYIAFIFDGVSHTNFIYTVGVGGIYNGTTNGSSSTIKVNGSTYTAEGGNGAGSAQRGAHNNVGFSGGYYLKQLGQPGTANDYSYSYGPGGNTIYKIIYGAGGGTYPSYIYTPGGTYVKNQTLGVDLHITESTDPFTPGSGGAANRVLDASCNGRSGYVRIYY